MCSSAWLFPERGQNKGRHGRGDACIDSHRREFKHDGIGTVLQEQILL